MKLFRNIRHGLLNFWRFRRDVWRWRGYSWEYDYDLFMRGLELTAEHIAKDMRHEDSEWRVYEIDLLVRRYRLFLGAVDKGGKERLWDLVHTTLKRHARSWWD